jgi:O-antigen/teichoic acid export membrane protein
VFFAFEKMEYDVLAQIVRAMLALGLGAGMIFLGYPLVQIVAVVICANIVKVLLSFGLLSRRITVVKFRIDIGFCRSLAAASAPFALLVVVNVVFSNVGVIMLRNIIGDTEVGWYASAVRINDMLLIVPGMFLTSIYPVLSNFYASSRESLALAYSKSYQFGLIVGLPMAAGLLLGADHVVAVVFGSGFENAGTVLRLLSFVIAVSFCNYVNGGTLNGMGRERLFAGLSTITVAVVILLNWVLIPMYSYLVVAVIQDIAVGLGFIVYSVLCHGWLKLALPWKTALKALTATLIMAVCVFYALQGGMNLAVVVLLIAPATYGGSLYLLRVLSSEDVLILKRAFRLV